MPDICIREATWQEDAHLLSTIRFTVFVEEQGVPAALELDKEDAAATHVLAITPDGIPVGTGRLLADGRIGRMAVLGDYRGRGIGRRLLDELLLAAERAGMSEVYLHAQLSARGFYSHAGFAPCGSTFMDAGIPHIEMRLALT